MSARLFAVAKRWNEVARADLDRTDSPARIAAGAARKSCAWELMRILIEMEKANPLESGPLSPHDADRESA